MLRLKICLCLRIQNNLKSHGENYEELFNATGLKKIEYFTFKLFSKEHLYAT